MNDFIVRALAAGFMIAIISGLLGSFVVWRRMSYFGDTLAHSSLLGIALGILLDVNLQLAVITSALLFAGMLLLLQRNKTIATDTLLGILSHSTLAFGLLILALSDTVQVNLAGYLFGDLLTVSITDILWILACGILTSVALLRFWNGLLTITVHEELARVEGVAVERLKALLVMLIALLIAVSMKIVGVLLITALLIIPPAAARKLANTPEQMALGASCIGCVAVSGGLWMSWQWDTPAGPSVVVTACGMFLALTLVQSLRGEQVQ
jgi:zinc transport system permease protein